MKFEGLVIAPLFMRKDKYFKPPQRKNGMKFIRELQETRFDPDSRGAQPRPHHREDIRTLLDAIAHAIPFVGYESSVEHIKDELDAAFKQVAGMDWHEWRKTGESKDV